MSHTGICPRARLLAGRYVSAENVQQLRLPRPHKRFGPYRRLRGLNKMLFAPGSGTTFHVHSNSQPQGDIEHGKKPRPSLCFVEHLETLKIPDLGVGYRTQIKM